MNDAGSDPFPLLHHIAGVQKVTLPQFRNVDKAFKSGLQTNEGAKSHHIRYHALHNVTHVIELIDLCPRIWQQVFEAQSHPALVSIQRDDLDLQTFAAVHHICRVAHSSPGEFRNMDQPFQAPQIYENSEPGKVCDGSGHNIAGLKARQ